MPPITPAQINAISAILAFNGRYEDLDHVYDGYKKIKELDKSTASEIIRLLKSDLDADNKAGVEQLRHLGIIV